MAACSFLVESAGMGDELKRAGWDKNRLVSLLDGELEQKLDGELEQKLEELEELDRDRNAYIRYTQSLCF